MTDSIFTKIINGTIPCHKVYEDNRTIVFMDIHPIQPGQVLVVPKVQVGFIWDLASADYQALMGTVQAVGKRLQQQFTDKSHIGVIVEGLDLPDHAHVKVFPFSNDAEFRAVPDQASEPDHAVLSALAKTLAF